MSGLELLRKMRGDKQFHDTIVFILTTSTDEKDKFEAYDLNVAGYMLKSDMGTSFIRAIEMVEKYWRVIEFPGCD
jgi:DNA-binding NarL/FixJ family response regulator